MIIKRVSLPSHTPERVCIAHVSDLHNKNLPELMDALRAEHPDMVLVS